MQIEPRSRECISAASSRSNSLNVESRLSTTAGRSVDAAVVETLTDAPGPRSAYENASHSVQPSAGSRRSKVSGPRNTFARILTKIPSNFCGAAPTVQRVVSTGAVCGDAAMWNVAEQKSDTTA